MTNLEKILFHTKYDLAYSNNEYILTGFDHLKTLHIKEDDIIDVLEHGIEHFDKKEWLDFIQDFSVSH